MRANLVTISLIGLLTLAGCQSTPDPVQPVSQPIPEPVAEAETDPNATIRDKYATIEYGQELAPVCSMPALANGKMSERPNVQLMWENYLYDRPDGIWGEIGGFVEINGNLPLDQGRWTNACTVRLSHMLNKAGHKIPRDGRKTVSGGNKDQYYYRVKDLEKYMLSAFGPPDLAITDGSADTWAIPAKPGILIMDFPGSSFSGHTTIWNGAGSVDNADIGGHRVLFWEMPCFVPEDRNSEPFADNGQSVDVTP